MSLRTHIPLRLDPPSVLVVTCGVRRVGRAALGLVVLGGVCLLAAVVAPGAERPGPGPGSPAGVGGSPAAMRVLRDIPYVEGGHERQRLDLYLPREGGPHPVLVSIHGGAFRAGSKEDDVPLEAVGLGFAVVSINYRLSQHALFPAQIADCKAAVRWVRAHAPEYGLDPGRIVSMGRSAGGHLAAMLGTAGEAREFDVGGHLDQSSRVQAVVDLYGPTDFLQMDAHRPRGGMVHDAADSPESQLVGGPIQQRPAQVALANPITFVGPGDPPFLVIHGDRDPLVPHHQSGLLVAALRKAGVPVTFHTVAGGGHGGFRDATVPRLIREFLLRVAGSPAGVQPRTSPDHPATDRSSGSR